MEADSTTYDNDNKSSTNSDISFPFPLNPSDYKLYQELTSDNGNGRLESQIVERLQQLHLLQKTMLCPIMKPECKLTCRNARVVDRMQWVCEACGTRRPVRTGSYFIKWQCPLIQALQIIFAWCQDADLEVAAKHFGVKPRLATSIYDKLEELTINEQKQYKLGGENALVLSEIYPDCLNQHSPDTTDQPHIHKILMLADTVHVPTHYWLHVIKEYPKKITNSATAYNKALTQEVQDVISKVIRPGSTVVTGNNVPQIEGARSLQQHLVHYIDVDMQHFLTTRVWSQAITLCSAARDICASTPRGSTTVTACAANTQKYLTAALYRIKHGDGFYRHVLSLLAIRETPNEPQSK